MPCATLIIFILLFSLSPAFAQQNSSEPVETVISHPVQMVSVTVNVVDIVLNDEHRAGVDWGAIVSDFHNIALKKEDNPIWTDKKYRLSVGTISEDDYGVLIDALDTVGKVTQHEQPTTDLSVGAEQIISIPDEHVKLQLSVNRDKDNYWIFSLRPNLNLSTYDARMPGKIAMLELRTQMDETITGSKTMVMGSIFEEQEITKTHKFPLLGDLPLVGLVFRSQGRLMQKTEKIIFITVVVPSSS